MANTKIRGLTLEINGDTTGLEKSLKSVNSEVKNTEKQLKDVEKLLKLDPTNTELLAQKQQLLAKNVEQTESKLKTLKDTQAEFVKQGGDVNSDGYKALEREIIVTENRLKDATKEANNFSANIEKASAKLQQMSNKADQVAKATKGISAVGGAVVGGLVGMGISSAKAADELNTLSKQTGLTTDELQRFQYASDIVDVSVSDIASGLKKLKSGMANGTAAFDSLGISTRDANGELRDANAVFYETLEALSNIDNETQRDVLAMELFGKNAASLSGIIDDGGAALKNMGKQAEDLGLILDQDTLDNMNAINDTIDEMKARFKATFAKTGAQVLDAIAPLIEDIAKGFGKVAEFIGKLGGKNLKTLLAVGGVVALISPVAAIIGKITGAANTLLPVIKTINTVVAANPTIAIITAIGLAVAALVTLIVKHWDEIKAVLGTVANWVRDKIINPIKSFFNGLWDTLKTGAKSFGNVFIGIANVVIRAVNKLIDGINAISFDVPSWVPFIAGKHFGLNIKKLNEIPMLAKGGTVGNGGTAIVGEAGAELLSVNNGQAVVRPLTNGGGSSAGSAITVNMNNTFNGYTSAQGAELGRDLARQINVALGRV